MHRIKVFCVLCFRSRALGHEYRVKILFLLRLCPYTQIELARILKMRQSNTAKHLRYLINAGFVEGKRQGKTVVFSLTKQARKSKKLWRVLEENYW